METKYWYNTLNQVEMQHTPDAGQSSFWYDRLGRLVVSQNQRQQFVSVPEQNRLYSYTEYDYLGRIREVGEIKNATSTKMSHALSRSPGSLESWMTASVAGKSQITSTTYDLAYGGFTLIQPIGQKNLRNRVSYTSYTDGSNPVQYNQASFYSYDIHGNVDTLVQDYGNSTFSAVQNVMNMNNNQFYHRYQYDAENRLTNVETSYDNTLWQKDARYEYYKHGPLARTLLGDQLVQGMDYAYTLQGWLKGMNSTALTPVQDMSGDGVTGGLNVNIACDVVGYNLNYYQGDYQAIGTSVAPFAPVNGSVLQGSYRPLYNGNISSMSVNISKFDGPVLYNYKYDRLNRLTQMDTWKGFNANGNNWSGITLTEDYKERIAYDPNGNILKYLRNTANNPSPMDSLNYKYYPGKNQLSRIRDNANPAIEGLKDIEDQPVDNYVYDLIGSLTADKSENITSIDWNVYGKITSILRSGVSGSNTAKRINYSYDAAGNRISKRVVKFGSAEVEYTWYVRDASGNVMGVYSAKKDTTGSSALPGFDVTLTEQHLYGSSRMGIQRRSENVEGALSIANVYKHVTGLRYYELSNHLGNVLATISDKKIGVASTSNSSLIDHYDADVVSAQDYYPFGMLMPGRSYSGSSYRYGFNGKENDNDVKGEGNQQDYGMRIYDPRAGRFLSVDPLTRSYPMLTPYQFASNRPIDGIDLDGLEHKLVTDWLANKAKAAGYPRLSGFIRSFGVGDVHTEVSEAMGDIFHGNYTKVAEKILLFTPTGMASSMGTLIKNAATGDKEAQGEVIGMGVQVAIGGVKGSSSKVITTASEEVTVRSQTASNAGRSVQGEGTINSTPQSEITITSNDAPLTSGMQRLVANAESANVTVKGSTQAFKNKAGVYVHNFESGTVYVGQAKNLATRPLTSLGELLDATGKGKGTANKAGDTYSGTTTLIPLEGSGYSTLNELEGAILKGYGGTIKQGGKTYNIRRVPGE